jgi:hypothetical protein
MVDRWKQPETVTLEASRRIKIIFISCNRLIPCQKQLPVLLSEADIIDKCPSSKAFKIRVSLGLLPSGKYISCYWSTMSLFESLHIILEMWRKSENLLKSVQNNIRRQKEKFRCTSCAQENNSSVERRKHKINKNYSLFYLINIRSFTY